MPNDLPFDIDAPAVGSGIYGLPYGPEDSRVVLIPVPWEATVSYRTGTVNGPAAIHASSPQLDLRDRETGSPYTHGIAMLPIPKILREMSDRARPFTERILAAGGTGNSAGRAGDAATVDALCEEMNAWVHETAAYWMDRGKLVGVVGGDHSVPFGSIRALAERQPGFGVLQLDAHADLRRAYAGLTWSHASIMYNVVERIPGVTRLVQAGIRDFAEQENRYIEEHPDRVRTFFESDLRVRLQDGDPWSACMRDIVAELPETVYLSFDIDGLDPPYCPNTGTPVPGGWSFVEAVSLIRHVVESGRRIIGFDLNEVSPDPRGQSEWDGNVGCRLLYKMIGFALLSERSA